MRPLPRQTLLRISQLICSSPSMYPAHLREHRQGPLAGIVSRLALGIHPNDPGDGRDEEDLLVEVDTGHMTHVYGFGWVGEVDREGEPGAGERTG